MTRLRGQPDVIVVGLGPAGATAAYALATAGMHVLALEAGPYRTKDEYRLDEVTESVFQQARLGPKFNQELQTWRSNVDAPSGPALYSLGKMNNGLAAPLSTLLGCAAIFQATLNDAATRSPAMARRRSHWVPQWLTGQSATTILNLTTRPSNG